MLIYLNIPGIPNKSPVQNSQVIEEQLDVGCNCSYYSSMIDIGTENEQSYKIYLNKLFFQNVLILLIFF